VKGSQRWWSVLSGLPIHGSLLHIDPNQVFALNQNSD
jgi:hypothetical protein